MHGYSIGRRDGTIRAVTLNTAGVHVLDVSNSQIVTNKRKTVFGLSAAPGSGEKSLVLEV